MSEIKQVLVPLVLYGVPFHNLTPDEVVEWAVERIQSKTPSSIAMVDLSVLAEVWDDPELRRVLVNADLVLAEGDSIIQSASKYGPSLKTAEGTNIVRQLVSRAAQEKMGVYFLGHAEGTMKKAMTVLKDKHADLKVSGTFSPPSDPLLEMDHSEILNKLDTASPDLLLVAFGAPKQDKFVGMHMQEWDVPLSIGVGLAFEYISGVRKLIPSFLRRSPLEWLWNLTTSPISFFRGNVKNLRFLRASNKQIARVRRMPDNPPVFQALAPASIEKLAKMDTVVEHFHPLKSEKDARKFVYKICSLEEKNIVLDIHDIAWLDSLELGALLEINKCCRKTDHRLVLYAPRPKIRQLLEVCGMLDYFNTASRFDILTATLKSLDHSGGGTLYKEGLLVLDLPTELTAATVPIYEKQAEFIRKELRQQGILKTVRVNAAKLEFVDSSGLGFLISLKKHTMDEEVEMVIANLDEKPRRIFEIARVDSVLLGD